MATSLDAAARITAQPNAAMNRHWPPSRGPVAFRCCRDGSLLPGTTEVGVGGMVASDGDGDGDGAAGGGIGGGNGGA